MTDTILVIGATGTTGRRLSTRLAARGITVRAAGRQPGDGRTPFDWNRPETHGPALAGVDAVYLIPPSFVEDPTDMTGPFLGRAQQAGVSKVVALSSLGAVFSDRGLQSGRRKLERQIMACGLEWTMLRPTGFAQNFSEGFMLPGILQADMVVTATGEGPVAFVDADDIAAVAAAALTQDGHAEAEYAITGPEALTFDEALATISRIARRTIAHRSVAPDEMAYRMRSAGVPDDYAAMLLRDMEGTRNGSSALVTDVVERVAGRRATRFADYAVQAASAWSRP